MRKAYTKPALEVEEYQLNKAIATNCTTTITWGPGAPGHEVCPEFEGSFDVVIASEAPSMNSSGNVPFYDDGSAGCDCYYTSGGNSYFSS